MRVRAEGIEGGFGRAPWPPTPRLWGEGRTHCRLKQTGGSSVLRSVRTEAPPVSAVHGLLGSYLCGLNLKQSITYQVSFYSQLSTPPVQRH